MFPVQSSGYGIGLVTQWSRLRFPHAAAMGNGLWADKPPQYFTQQARSTQPSTLSGVGKEYQPK